MARMEDVAAYILTKIGPITAMKLQKLCYYAQAWHLAWEDQQLFDSRIEAWANGPVIPELYRQHRGRLHLSPGDIAGDPARLAGAEQESIDLVLDFYGEMTAHHLCVLTHREDPWRQARAEARLSPMERGAAEIPSGAMHEYFRSLATAQVSSPA
jgi:uncharacterized phage-associated protein